MAQRAVEVIGHSANQHSDIRAAPPKIQKAVYCVSNVDPSISEKALTQFFEKEMGVRVLTIYPISTENRAETAIAFRVCIPAEDHDKFCDTSLLPDGIVIREWVFKSSNGTMRGSNNAGSEESREIRSPRGVRNMQSSDSSRASTANSYVSNDVTRPRDSSSRSSTTTLPNQHNLQPSSHPNSSWAADSTPSLDGGDFPPLPQAASSVAQLVSGPTAPLTIDSKSGEAAQAKPTVQPTAALNSSTSSSAQIIAGASSNSTTANSSVTKF